MEIGAQVKSKISGEIRTVTSVSDTHVEVHDTVRGDSGPMSLARFNLAYEVVN
jgi:hypothetical protein